MLLLRPMFWRSLPGLALVLWVMLPAAAAEKGDMPDLSQEEQTCLPTSTANLLIWFGKHGYPKLILSGDTEEDRELHTLHAIMQATNASYQWGTRTEAITSGIQKFIRDAGYSCDVEYRGMDWSQAKFPHVVQDPDAEKDEQDFKTPLPFTQDWLQENNDPNKGFILLLAYCTYDRSKNLFSDALNAGHAVTLVNAEPNLILIDDPAHENDEPGRKILTPQLLTGGAFQLPGYDAPVSGLLLLSGSMLDAPPDAGVMLTGAVCITMHPDNQNSTIVASTASAPNATMGGSTSSSPAASPTPPAPTPNSASASWGTWLFNLLFAK